MRGVYSVFARRAVLFWLCFVAGTVGGAAVGAVVTRGGPARCAADVTLEKPYPAPASEILQKVAAAEGAYIEPNPSGGTVRVLVPAKDARAASEDVKRIVSQANSELRALVTASFEEKRKRAKGLRAAASEAKKHRESATARKLEIRRALPWEFDEEMRPRGRAEAELVGLRRGRKDLEAKLASKEAALLELNEHLRALPEMVVVRTEAPDWMSHPGYVSLKKKRDELKGSLKAAPEAERASLAKDLATVEARVGRLEALTKNPPARIEGPNPARAGTLSRMGELHEETASLKSLLEHAKRDEDAASARVGRVVEGSKEAEMLQATITEERARAGELAKEIDSFEKEAAVLQAALNGPDPVQSFPARETPGSARASWRGVVGLGMVLGLCAGLALIAVAEAVRPAVRTPEDLEELLGIPPVAVIKGSAPGGQLPDWRSGGRRRFTKAVRWLLAAALAATLAGGAFCWPEIRAAGARAGKEARE